MVSVAWQPYSRGGERQFPDRTYPFTQSPQPSLPPFVAFVVGGDSSMVNVAVGVPPTGSETPVVVTGNTCGNIACRLVV